MLTITLLLKHTTAQNVMKNLKITLKYNGSNINEKLIFFVCMIVQTILSKHTPFCVAQINWHS